MQEASSYVSPSSTQPADVTSCGQRRRDSMSTEHFAERSRQILHKAWHAYLSGPTPRISHVEQIRVHAWVMRSGVAIGYVLVLIAKDNRLVL